MVRIGRRAELCQEPVVLRPCPYCGSAAAIVEVTRSRPLQVRRICCGVSNTEISDASLHQGGRRHG